MTTEKKRSDDFSSFLIRPEIGSALTILSGLSFLLLSMLLPLVGKAGAKTEHYGINFAAFLIVLLITGSFSVLALKSKFARRKIDGSPKPIFSMILCGLCILLFISLMLGLLKI